MFHVPLTLCAKGTCCKHKRKKVKIDVPVLKMYGLLLPEWLELPGRESPNGTMLPQRL
jgi:hypothetical protein